MTLACQNAKKARVESIKQTGGVFSLWAADNVKVPLIDFLSGTAEVTGQTLKLVGMDAVGKAGLEVVKGTGKIVIGSGKLAGDVVLGTGKFAGDVVLGTGKFATDVVVGTVKVRNSIFYYCYCLG